MVLSCLWDRFGDGPPPKKHIDPNSYASICVSGEIMKSIYQGESNPVVPPILSRIGHKSTQILMISGDSKPPAPGFSSPGDFFQLSK